MAGRIVPQDFYVYIHRKPATGEIFYVGKGCEKRAWDTKERNRHWKAVARKHGFVVEIVEAGLQEWAAFELERCLIALYGRNDLGLGNLVNYTDGGEGSCGVVQSEKTRQKKAAMRIGKKHSEAVKSKISETNRITKSTPEQRKQMADRVSGEKNPMFGKKASEETRAKMIKSRTGQHRATAKPIFCSSLGKTFRCVKDAHQYITSIGQKISKSSIKSAIHTGKAVCGHTFSLAQT